MVQIVRWSLTSLYFLQNPDKMCYIGGRELSLLRCKQADVHITTFDVFIQDQPCPGVDISPSPSLSFILMKTHGLMA